MSNSRIVGRLRGLADDVELGTVSVAGFRDELLGHTEALEGVSYHHLKQAQVMWAQLTRAIESGQEQAVDVHLLGNWLREWVEQVPREPA